jgi:hypothetical protein
MADQVNWQRQLTFSDRLSVTSKMQANACEATTEGYELTNNSAEAYKEANPECIPSDATKHAKLEESAARKDASTLVRYRPS